MISLMILLNSWVIRMHRKAHSSGDMIHFSLSYRASHCSLFLSDLWYSFSRATDFSFGPIAIYVTGNSEQTSYFTLRNPIVKLSDTLAPYRRTGITKFF